MSQLPNYLSSGRKRRALSQKDVACLLHVQCGANVCRHEKFEQIPNLKTAIAYEIIYQKPISDLFAGLYEQAEKEIRIQAAKLLHKTKRSKTNPLSNRRNQTLDTLAGGVITRALISA